jgi:hypothetical protein
MMRSEAKYCYACGTKLKRMNLGNDQWVLRCTRKKCGLYFPTIKFIPTKNNEL